MNKKGCALLFSTLFVVCTLWTAHDAVGQSSKEQLVGAWTLVYFGTYSVNEPEKVINLKLAGTTFSNLLARGDQKRIITSLTQDELKFHKPEKPLGCNAGGGLEASQVECIGQTVNRRSSKMKGENRCQK